MSGAQMLLKPRIMDPKRRDDISEALLAICGPQNGGPQATPAYMVNWYPEGLRERTLGPHSKKLTGVSRYYPTLSPKVVVDFEPAHPDKWYHDEKVQFFAERNILYIAITLQDRLTEEEFTARYKDRKQALDRFRADGLEQAALDGATLVEHTLADETVSLLIDKLATQRAKAVRDRFGRPLGGAALQQRLKAHKQAIVAEYRKKLRHGMDAGGCARELTSEIERPDDGQAAAPDADRASA